MLLTKLKEMTSYCKCAPGLKRVLKHKDKYKGKFPSVFHSRRRVECTVLSDMRCRETLVCDLYCESLHGAFAQSLDVVQETGRGQNVRRPWKQSMKKKKNTFTFLNGSSRGR